jgi:GTP-binding protein
MDLPEVQKKWDMLKRTLKKRGYDAFAISALTRDNLQPVLWKAHELLLSTPKQEITPELPVYKPKEDPRDFTIVREGDGWRVKGASIERAAEMTYWEHDGSVRRFHHLMGILGVDVALRKQGIQEGDTVYIRDYELEWQD